MTFVNFYLEQEPRNSCFPPKGQLELKSNFATYRWKINNNVCLKEKGKVFFISKDQGE